MIAVHGKLACFLFLFSLDRIFEEKCSFCGINITLFYGKRELTDTFSKVKYQIDSTCVSYCVGLS